MPIAAFVPEACPSLQQGEENQDDQLYGNTIVNTRQLHDIY